MGSRTACLVVVAVGGGGVVVVVVLVVVFFVVVVAPLGHWCRAVAGRERAPLPFSVPTDQNGACCHGASAWLSYAWANSCQ